MKIMIKRWEGELWINTINMVKSWEGGFWINDKHGGEFEEKC